MEEASDLLRPDLAHNIWFWFWQIVHWLGYALISVVYVPWAFAMHVIILVLLIPLAPLLCWRGGRKFFIYVYVITVVLPGKFIWFNTLVKTRRRGRVWDFEMGRPRPIPLQSRRRLSEDVEPSKTTSQSGSAFLIKLPPEIRIQIYREIFTGASRHLHVVQRKEERSRGRPPVFKIRGYLCAREHGEQKDAKCNCMLGSHAHHSPPHESEVELPLNYSQGRLALLQTCRQVYNEAIEQLYREPKFCFNNLEQPPFFLRSVLPSRLALIQRIQLCYKQYTMTQPRSAGTSLAKYLHRIQQCTFCNLTTWLRMIQQLMTGLRLIEVFLYLDKKMPVPRLGQPWIVNLLALQSGPNGLRSMKLKVFCNLEEGSATHSDYRKEVKDFMKGVQKELKRVAVKKRMHRVPQGGLRAVDVSNLIEEPSGEQIEMGSISALAPG